MASPPYLTMAAIARLYRVHEATARRWAREDGWRRTTVRPIRYSTADAQASWDKRHSGRIAHALAERYGTAQNAGEHPRAS